MFARPALVLLVTQVALLLGGVEARFLIPERDGRAIFARRFGQEHPQVIEDLGKACPGQICGVLSGAAITPLLAAQPECSQQDMADQIIDAALKLDPTTRDNMIKLAVTYRQVEKNTPPDFTTNPPTNRNSVFCQKAPRHKELDGLFQAQDPGNGPDAFFDPATKATVKLGSQPNTFPFGTKGMDCSKPPANPDDKPKGNNSTTNGDGGNNNNNKLGSCSVPEIEFGLGFDGRKETSFQPVDKTSFSHGSAQNIVVITGFICDRVRDTCGGSQADQDTCAKAAAAALAATPPKSGVQADAFNAVFGITTNFANIAALDNQGHPVTATGNNNGGNNGSNNNCPSTKRAVPRSFFRRHALNVLRALADRLDSSPQHE